MTPNDQRVLFLSLAFHAYVVRGDGSPGSANAQRVRRLASLMETFCRENARALPRLDLPEETGVAYLDEAIEKHVKELREQEVTVLPESREAFVQLYDRLQLRQSRRRQCDIYASATVDALADLVLRHLDEEIRDLERLT